MLGLVWKDLVQGRRMLLFYLVVGTVVAASLSFALSDVGAVVAMQMTLSAYGFAIRSTYDDDRSRALLFLKGLPLSDAAIVASKFVSTFIVAAAFAVFSGGLAAVAQGIVAWRAGAGAGFAAPHSAAMAAGSVLGALTSVVPFFGVLLVVLATYLAMFFCLGYARAAAYNRIIMLGVFAVGMGAFAALGRAHVQPPAWLASLGETMVFPLVLAGLGLVVYVLSCVVSIGWVRARDWS